MNDVTAEVRNLLYILCFDTLANALTGFSCTEPASIISIGNLGILKRASVEGQ